MLTRISALALAIATALSAATVVYDLSPGTEAGHDIRVKVTFTDVHNRAANYIKGTVEVVAVTPGYTGDIRGIYLDARADSPFTVDVFKSSVVAEDPITGIAAPVYGNSLGPANNVPSDWGIGGLYQPSFDLGIQFGTAGATPDFLPFVVFWLDNAILSNSFSLSANAPTIEELAVRVTSINTVTGAGPDDSGKYHYFQVEVHSEVPEPATYGLVAVALAGVGFARRRFTRRTKG